MADYYVKLPVTGGAGGVTTLNSLSGALTLIAGSNIVITDNGTDAITIATTGGTSTFPLLAPDGGAASPEFSFASDQVSGMYLISTGVLGWSAAGVQQLSLSASALTPSVPIKMYTASLAFPPAYGFAGGDDDTGMYSTGDGNVSIQTNGMLNVEYNQNTTDFYRTVTIHNDLAVTGNISAANYPPTGSVNTFAGYDASGVLNPIPGWSVDPNTFGMNVNESFDLSLGNQNMQSMVSDFSPTSSTVNTGTGFNFVTRYDQAGLGFDNDHLDGMGIGEEHIGNGHLNFFRALYTNQNIGNGSSTSTVDQANNVDFFTGVQAGATVRDVGGIGYNLNNSGTITEDVQLMRLFSSGNAFGRNSGGIDINIQNDVNGSGNENIISLSSSGTKANASNGIFGNFQQNSNDFTGVQMSKSGVTTQNETGFFSNSSGTAGQDATMFAGSRSNTATVGGNSNGLNINDQSDSGGFVGVNVFKSGNTTDSGRSLKGIQMDLNGNSAQSIYGATISIQGTAASNATALLINMTNAHSSSIPISIDTQGGTNNLRFELNTSAYMPTAFSSFNNVGGQLNISAGFPLVATPVFLNNFGWNINFDDDATADNFLGAGDSLGQSIMAFVNQIAGTATVDTFNYVLLGGSNVDAGTGHINELNIYRGIGLLNAGGGMTVDNQRLFYVDPGFDGALGTNKWGFINASSTNNWMKGTLVLGGTTGLPTGSFALDVTGNTVVSGDVAAATVTPANGATGTFTTVDLKTVTVTNGIITSIV